LIGAPELLSRYGHLFEHSPWVVERAASYAPFIDAQELHRVLMEVVAQAGDEEQLALIRAHPQLAVETGPLTEASASEQKNAGLKSLSEAEFERFATLNREYQEKFGFPFIICVRMHSKMEIFAAFERRLRNGEAAERAKALVEIGHITRLRLKDMVEVPKMVGLTTHVLDTVRGTGAAGMRVEVRQPLKTPVATMLDENGRAILLNELVPGPHEIKFHAGAYMTGTKFYDVIPVRFVVEEGATHIHIPLILSAFGYSTYRGG
jgi:2-oxo-4-hydroxy-4-carboxy-5-ureidoimidazoline decarboxylase